VATARLPLIMDGANAPERLDLHVDRLLMPDLVAVLVSGLPAAAMLLFRHDLAFAWGSAPWGLAAAGLTAIAVFATIRLFDRRPLLVIGIDGLALPRLVEGWIPWSDIAAVESRVEPLAWGDRCDVLRIDFHQPRQVAWLKPPKGPVDAGGLQAGLGIRLTARWPVRAETLKRQIDAWRLAAPVVSVAAAADDAPHWSWPARGLRLLASAMAGILLATLWQITDGGLSKRTSAGVRLYQAGDLAAALPVLEADARRGDAEAQLHLAEMYENGDGTARNPAAALAWVRRAAADGHAAAETRLGVIHQQGRSVPVDMVAARTWYARAAERGAAAAQFRLGRLYRDGLVDGRRDYARALLWLTRAARQDHAAAATDLARLHAEGLGVEQDMVVAVDWLMRAAGQDHAPALHRLGQLYGRGQGVDKDTLRAADFHRRAAERGYAPAQYALGLAHTGGVGVAQDPVAAYVWLALAQKGLPSHQVPRAQRLLARITPKLDAEALAHARRAVREFRPRRRPG